MRYSRQEKLKFIPKGFQEKISSKKIVLVGCGGVGSVLAELLVRGGFKNLFLIDNDLIDETNLQRQVYFEEDIGSYKSKTLEKYLKKIDKSVKVKVICEILDKDNISKICDKSDLIVDCSDNFEIRFVINEYCESKNKDWLYNGAVKTEIMSCMFYGKDKLFSKIIPPNVCDEKCCDVGVLASTTYSSASLAYNQILKYFLEEKEYVLIKIDLWENRFHKIKIK